MTKPLYVAVVAMLLQQALAYMSTLVLPVVSPVIAADLGLNVALVGTYTALMYVASMASALSSGGFITRYGGLRVSQVSLLLLGAGLLLAMPGPIWCFALSALVIGTGSAVSTPSSSDILARYSPPRKAPLIFSIKQTGVPVGGILAGLSVPFLAAIWGWRGAFLASAAVCVLFALALQPLRAEFDRERKPGFPLSPRGIFKTLREVLASGPLRSMALASITWVGLQAIYGAFLVAYLTERLNYPLETAGLVFASGQVAAVPARIFWGYVSSRWVSPRRLLGGLGLVMASASVAMGLFSEAWPAAGVVTVAMVFAGTAISWHGVLLAEIAHLAPPGHVGRMVGGVLAFTSIGIMTYPALFAAVLGHTGSYAAGFFAAALPALIAGLMMFRRSAPAVLPR